MQAIFILSLFSMMLTVVASIISSGTSNTSLLTKERIAETNAFFQSVENVVLNDITIENMHGNPMGYATPAEYIRNESRLSSLSNGRLADPALDAWGRPIAGVIFTEYLSLTNSSDPDNRVMVPVTGIVMVSGGPDGVIQTNIPAVTSLVALQGIVVPSNAAGAPANDDIIYTFDNRTIQQNYLATLKSHMERIGTAALKEYQARVSSYRQVKLDAYKANIAAGRDVPAPDLTLAGDANAPRMMALANTTAGIENRRALGVDEDFNEIQRILPRNGRMVVTAPQPASAVDPLIITINNDSANPTPWGRPSNSLNYVVRVDPSDS
ncbi:MAG: hypothetical protein DI585_02255 [Pseudomonas fluorescens]|nr:MAG: hypothetical protein DI585_02255 [Pseudomonas fluorescens]